MALNLTTPTVRPPSSLDVEDPNNPGETLPEPTPTTATYEPSTTANRADALAQPMQQFAEGALASPSRYDADIVQRGIGLINDELERSRIESESQLDEFMSQRGLIGSDIETKGRTDLLTNLEMVKTQRLQDLEREMATTFANDRMAASQIGSSAGNYLGSLDTRDINEARYGAEFSRLTGQDAFSQALAAANFEREGGLQTRALDLQERGLNLDDAYRYAALDQDGTLSQAALDLQQAAQAGGQWVTDPDSGEQVWQESLASRELSLDEAFRQAQFTQQKDEWADSLGLSQQEFDLQRDQMVNVYGGLLSDGTYVEGEQTADRVFQREMFDDEQAFRETQASFDRALERDAMVYQNGGMLSSGEWVQGQLGYEDAWREADRTLQEALETRAQDLQAEGMERDTAYQQAVLDMESQQMQQTAQLANQEAQLSAADIFLRALAAGGFDTPEGAAQADNFNLASNWFNSLQMPAGGLMPPQIQPSWMWWGG